jgi:pyruvate/2-oxoacid:ferredoxin oxidoreductase beta subunit
MSEQTEQSKLVAKIIKATSKKKGPETVDKLCEYPVEYLKELLKVIENLKK